MGKKMVANPPGTQIEGNRGNFRSEPRLRTIAIVIVVPALVTLSLVLLFAQPLVSTPFDRSLYTSGYLCSGPEYCPRLSAWFEVGNGNSGTIRGTWLTQFTGAVEVLVYDGANNSLCNYGDTSQCPGLLYSSGSQYPRGISGSFDVGGIGPFHVVVSPLMGSANTTVQGTVDMALF
jgi:hypothetical protein